jgi:membrane-anchored protein YejM (alkaline phosphatase superfamily)
MRSSAGGDNSLIPEFRRTMAAPGRKFAFLFYYGTHYPYEHSDKYQRHGPEVPPDFDYSIWNLEAYARPIINRYENALEEFDTWLGALLQTARTRN